MQLYDAQHQNEDKEGKLGSKAPVWIPDVRVSMCMVCTDDFTVTNRRHHCRACGKVCCIRLLLYVTTIKCLLLLRLPLNINKIYVIAQRFPP